MPYRIIPISFSVFIFLLQINNSFCQIVTGLTYQPKADIYESFYDDRIFVGFDVRSAGKMSLPFVIINNRDSVFLGPDRLISFYPSSDSMPLQLVVIDSLYKYNFKHIEETKEFLGVKKYVSDIKLLFTEDSLKIIEGTGHNDIAVSVSGHMRIPDSLKNNLYWLEIPAAKQYYFPSLKKYFIDGFDAIGAKYIELKPGNYKYFIIPDPLEKVANSQFRPYFPPIMFYFQGEQDSICTRFKKLLERVELRRTIFKLNFEPFFRHPRMFGIEGISFCAGNNGLGWRPFRPTEQIEIEYFIFENPFTGFINFGMATKKKYLPKNYELILKCIPFKNFIVFKSELLTGCDIDSLLIKPANLITMTEFEMRSDTLPLYIVSSGDTAEYSIVQSPIDITLRGISGGLQGSVMVTKKIEPGTSWIYMGAGNKRGAEIIDSCANSLIGDLERHGVRVKVMEAGNYPLKLFWEEPIVYKIEKGEYYNSVDYRQHGRPRILYGESLILIFINNPPNSKVVSDAIKKLPRYDIEAEWERTFEKPEPSGLKIY